MKKQGFVLGAVALTIAALLGLCACGASEDPAPDTDATVEATASDQDDAKKDADKDSAKTEETQQKGAEGKTQDNPDSQGQKTSGGTTKPGHTHTWATRYVVDQKAWTETVHHPEVVEHPPAYDYYQCNGCGFNTTSHDEILAHMKSSTHSYRTEVGGGGSVLVSEAWDETINHPEKGHNETYCTKCGAVK